MEKKLIARWETRLKKQWYELYQDGLGFTYKGDSSGGNLGIMIDKDSSIAQMAQMIDATGVTMKRVV